MSGHSKWSNIKHKKEKSDAAKAKVFTKIGKEIAMAVKAGGPDPAVNGKLRDLIAKAKSNNVPNDNIDRIIKKSSGADAVDYEEVTYEGYGPSGVAVIVIATTDNRNRTGSNVRHAFDKFGGNLGQPGCVSFMFSDKGVIVVDKDTADEDKLMEDSLESGAEDFSSDGDVYEIYTLPEDVDAVADALREKGYELLSAEKDKIPANYVALSNEDDIKNMNKMLDMLEEDEDISDVYHNWENAE